MHVTIIAKSPEPGRVKTRMCPPCSLHQAAAVAAASLRDTIAMIDVVAAACGARRVLLWDGEPPPAIAGYDVVAQEGDRLGERLANGFRRLGPGAIIGMETPHATGFLAGAVRAAERGVDSVGLATDGGYWSIGLCAGSVAIVDEVFGGVPMGRSYTGLAQLRQLHQLGRPVRLLPMVRDLDTFDDVRAVACSGRRGELPALARRLVAAIDG